MRRALDEGPVHSLATVAPQTLVITRLCARFIGMAFGAMQTQVPCGAECMGLSLAFARLRRTKDCAQDDNR
jgi:hypothetical protein